jgi:hypothetical protein
LRASGRRRPRGAAEDVASRGERPSVSCTSLTLSASFSGHAVSAPVQLRREAADNDQAMDVTPHPEDGRSAESKDDLVSRRSRGAGRLLITSVVVVEALWIAALVAFLVWFVVR